MQHLLPKRLGKPLDASRPNQLLHLCAKTSASRALIVCIVACLQPFVWLALFITLLFISARAWLNCFVQPVLASSLFFSYHFDFSAMFWLMQFLFDFCFSHVLATAVSVCFPIVSSHYLACVFNYVCNALLVVFSSQPFQLLLLKHQLPL